MQEFYGLQVREQGRTLGLYMSQGERLDDPEFFCIYFVYFSFFYRFKMASFDLEQYISHYPSAARIQRLPSKPLYRTMVFITFLIFTIFFFERRDRVYPYSEQC